MIVFEFSKVPPLSFVLYDKHNNFFIKSQNLYCTINNQEFSISRDFYLFNNFNEFLKSNLSDFDALNQWNSDLHYIYSNKHNLWACCFKNIEIKNASFKFIRQIKWWVNTNTYTHNQVIIKWMMSNIFRPKWWYQRFFEQIWLAFLWCQSAQVI